MRRVFLIFSFFVLWSSVLLAQELQSFPLSSVKLLESPFRKAQHTDLEYIMEMDPDRLLAPYLSEAGLDPEAENYGNWENGGLDGHIGGHYLSALAMMYAATGEEEVLERLEYMLNRLREAQQLNGNGYLAGIPDGEPMWQEVAAGNIRAGGFSLNDRWVPLYNIHKIFAGLRDAHHYVGSALAKTMLVELSDWFLKMTRDLSDEQIQDMLRSEHGGLNETFAEVYALTGDKKYLELAERMSHEVVLAPLLQRKDELTGMHANTQIPKVIGYERIAQLNGDSSWSKAADFFWDIVVRNRTVSIGGNSVREHFHPASDFSSMIQSNQGPETCNTYNMMRLSKLLFLHHPDREYLDYYERAMYNHILSSQHPDGGFVYFTPQRPQHYRVYSQPHEGFWCCVGSGLENHGKYGELIYAHADDELYVNLFVASTLDWIEQEFSLTQTTNFPYESTSTLTLQLRRARKMALKIRQPSWVVGGGFAIAVNGQAVAFRADDAGYATVERVWKSGDQVTIALPMETTVEYLPDNSSWASFLHGPIVLAAETDGPALEGLRADDSRMGHVAHGEFLPIDQSPLLVNRTGDITESVRVLNKDSLRFTIAGNLFSNTYKSLTLRPFFNLHDSRYTLYWRVAKEDQLKRIQEAMRVREKELLALEAATVDQVTAGEQQPETEHRYAGEESSAGSTDEGQAWRSTRKWFSYEFTNESRQGKTLRITHAQNGPPRTFDVVVNDQVLKTVELSGSRESGSANFEVKLPQSVLDSAAGDKLTVKLAAREGSSTGHIYSIRLLK